jgi:TPR repeat protein
MDNNDTVHKTLAIMVAVAFLFGSAAAMSEDNPWNAKANTAMKQGDKRTVSSVCDKISWSDLDHPPEPAVYLEVAVICAQNKTPGAAATLSNGYYWGSPTRDGRESFFWGLQAAKQGNNFGMLSTCRNYAQGFGTPINLKRAEEWCNKAINAGGAETARMARKYLAGSQVQDNPGLDEAEIERRIFAAEQAGRAQQRINSGKSLW